MKLLFEQQLYIGDPNLLTLNMGYYPKNFWISLKIARERG
jgi:hypothetical protein